MSPSRAVRPRSGSQPTSARTFSRRRSAFFADSTTSSGAGSGTGRSSGRVCSSSSTLAMAPWAPNEETAAMRGTSAVTPATVRVGRFHCSSSCCTRTGESEKSM
ncbi:hypothetical protein GCM10010219_25840 [Streptomyces netropsis]|nr:hypothetical protein GCM10010219_25840 [Streptomyces netropsis]